PPVPWFGFSGRFPSSAALGRWTFAVTLGSVAASCFPSRRGQRMRRRDLLGLVGGGLVLPPFGVAAQQNKTAPPLARVPLIGFIAPGSQDAAQGFLDAFREALHPFASGEDSPVIVDRWAEGQAERFSGIAKQLIGSQVEALVTV